MRFLTKPLKVLGVSNILGRTWAPFTVPWQSVESGTFQQSDFGDFYLVMSTVCEKWP